MRKKMRNIILEAIYLQILIVKNILFFSLSNKKKAGYDKFPPHV